MKIEKLSERIRFAMEKKGIKSNLDLVRAADVSEASLYKWLRDEEIPRGRSRIKLALALGVDPEWLRTGEGGMESEPAPKQPYAWMVHLAPTHGGRPLVNEGIVNLVIGASQEASGLCASAGIHLEPDQMAALVKIVVQRCVDENVLPERQHVADALAQLIQPR